MTRTERLRKAVEAHWRCKASHYSTKTITGYGENIISGSVEVFNIDGVPGAWRCYAWTSNEGEDTRCISALKGPRTGTPQASVELFSQGTDRNKQIKVSFAEA